MMKTTSQHTGKDSNGFFQFNEGEWVDEPVVSHEKPGAADHEIVELDTVLDPILSDFRTKSQRLFTFHALFVFKILYYNSDNQMQNRKTTLKNTVVVTKQIALIVSD